MNRERSAFIPLLVNLLQDELKKRENLSGTIMCVLTFLTLILAMVCPTACFPASPSLAQGIDDRIISEHIRIRIPMEREWLGRDAIMEFERCYKFVNAAAGDRMARRIEIDIVWDRADATANLQDSRLVIGMNTSAAQVNMRAYLIHSVERELARLALLSLSKGGAVREDSEFLMEGMSEILAHEFARSSRGLAGAWLHAQFLDQMGQLGLSTQVLWSKFSEGRHDLRAAAPGITFLLICRETYGRERTLKLFEILHRGTLDEGFAATFKTSSRALQDAWLKKVRAYPPPADFTASSDEDAPKLEHIDFMPPNPRAGTTLQVRLFVRTAVSPLLPEGIYLQDESSRKVVQPRAADEKNAKYFQTSLPIEPERKPGSYSLRIVALDDDGNIRNWTGSYTVDQ